MYTTADGLKFSNKTDAMRHYRVVPDALKFAYSNFESEELLRDSWYLIGYLQKNNTIVKGFTVRMDTPVYSYTVQGKLIDIINHLFNNDDPWIYKEDKFILEVRGQDGNAADC